MTHAKQLWLGAALALLFGAAHAQDWPQRTIRIVVPYGPGSSPDVVARIVNEKLAERLAQPLIVENRAGAGGISGTDYVAKAAPDGYTFVLSVNAPLVYNTVLFKTLPYDPFKDLAPVSLAVTTPNVCAVSNGFGVDSVAGWLDALRRDPDKHNFASTGNGSIAHLGVELIKAKTGSKAVHVPYTSSGQAVTALVQGDVQFACLPPVTVMPIAQAGRIKAIAVTSAQRFEPLAELPTLRESGLPELQAVPWYAYMAPKDTPTEVVQRMSREIAAVLKDPVTRQRLQTAYFDPVGSTPEELATFMNEELARWKPVIEGAGLKPD